MNVPVTSIYVSSMIIPNVVMIHRHWLKKITVELGKVTKKKGYAVKIGIFQGQFKLLVENNSMFSSPAFVFLYFSKTVFTVAILDRVKKRRFRLLFLAYLTQIVWYCTSVSVLEVIGLHLQSDYFEAEFRRALTSSNCLRV